MRRFALAFRQGTGRHDSIIETVGLVEELGSVDTTIQSLKNRFVRVWEDIPTLVHSAWFPYSGLVGTFRPIDYKSRGQV